METTLGARTLINLQGFCLYCLGRIDRNCGSPSPSPAGSAVPLLSSPCTPLRNRFVHSLPLEERIPPFVDLCRYLGIDVPDDFVFGDGIETETLTPPLCHKCHELSSRLCMLQEELQYIQTRIQNTTKRIYQRIQATCGDQGRGALKRDAFQKEFKSKAKGLSRGRVENASSRETKKALDLLKAFQLKILEKAFFKEVNGNPKEHISALFPVYQSPKTPCSDLITEVGSEDVVTEINHEDLESNVCDPIIEAQPVTQDIDEENETENYLPSETLHWTMNNTLLECTAVAGHKKGKLNNVDAYRLELQTLSDVVEEKTPSRVTPRNPIQISQSRDRPASGPGDGYKMTPVNFLTPSSKRDRIGSSADSSPKRRNRLEFNGEGLIDSSKVTLRTHRLKARRCLLPRKTPDRKEVNDDDSVILLPF